MGRARACQRCSRSTRTSAASVASALVAVTLAARCSPADGGMECTSGSGPNRPNDSPIRFAVAERLAPQPRLDARTHASVQFLLGDAASSELSFAEFQRMVASFDHE